MVAAAFMILLACIKLASLECVVTSESVLASLLAGWPADVPDDTIDAKYYTLVYLQDDVCLSWKSSVDIGGIVEGSVDASVKKQW